MTDRLEQIRVVICNRYVEEIKKLKQELEHANEWERQLQGRVKMLEDREQLVHELGAGYSAPKLENRELRTKIKDLEASNARLREALTNLKHLHEAMEGTETETLIAIYKIIEATLAVQPAKENK